MSMSQVSFMCSRAYGGRGILAVSLQSSHLQSRRNASDDVKFITKTNLSSLKRGRGGRSSFSGVVATIFGASGFIGSYVCSQLGKTGTQMIIPYRGDSYDVRHLKIAGDLGQMQFQPFHLLDEESIRNAVKYSDVVINLIGRDWQSRNFTYKQVHIDGAARIARISKEMGVEKFIYVSALNSDREHEGYNEAGGSKFLQTKGQGEEAVRAIFPEATIFRPSDIFGMEDRFFQYFARSVRRQFIRHVLFLPFDGKGIWKQPVYASDVAQGIANAVYDPDAIGRTYAAVGPKRYELKELVNYLYRVMRKEPPIFGQYDMKWNPFFYYWAKAHEMISMSNPHGMVIPDRLEREVVTDIAEGLPNLLDLGVNLTPIEDKASWCLEAYRVGSYHYDKPGELPPVVPAKFIAAV